ncbi:hypothetical protein [Rathayibacter sp. AY2B3]|uniref:hypothetical protein n=1 Tax=Rathayibacter sp. AY2B3 TaxID=2080569 RepID=UPI0011B077F0|nr:hypothetical protein [Rathayibacter sp. AY2B3]
MSTVFTSAADAQTIATDQDGSGTISMGRMVDRTLVPITEEEIASATRALPDPPSPTGSDGKRPLLLDWEKWFDCFTLNHADDVYAEYVHYWDGIGKDVRLKCGEGDADRGWGYKHISGKHMDQWQHKLDGARQAGWKSQSQGVFSWDDLMAAAAGEAVTWPEYKGGNFLNQTSCGVTQLYFWNTQTGDIVYTFKVRAGWSNTNDRLLTAFPYSGVSC